MRRASGEPLHMGGDEPSGFSAVLSGATAVGAIHVSSPASAHDEAKSDTSESSDSEKVSSTESQGNARVGAIHVFSPASGSGAEEKKLDPDNSKKSAAKMKGQQDASPRVGAIHVPAAAASPNDEVEEDTSGLSTSEKACAKKSQRDARVGAIHFFPPASRNGAEEDTVDPVSSMKISAKKQGQHDTRVGAIHVPGSAAASPHEAIEDTCEPNSDSKPSAEKGHLDRRVGAIHVPSPAAFTQNEAEEDTFKPNSDAKPSAENGHSNSRVGAIHMPPPTSQNGLQEDTNLGVGKSMDNVKGSANSSTSMHDRAILYTLNEDDDEPADNPNLCLPDKSNPQHPLTLQPPPLRRASVREVPNQPGAFSVEGSSNIESERTSEEDAAVPLTSTEIDPEDALRQQQQQNNNDAGLATALPIQEEERQIARESNAVGPNQTAPDRNRRSRLLCCVVAVVIGGAILATVGAVCGSGLCGSNDSGVIVPLEEETMAPIGTYHREPMEVSRFMWQFGAAFGVDYLEQAVDSAGFLVEARNDALHWILYEDPLQLEATSDHLLQRFVLALLYFHTTKDRLWTECNPSPNPSSFCYYTEGPGCDDCYQDSTVIWGDNWLSNAHECMWGGVICSQKDKQLVDLNLRFNDLNGPLPWELSKLTQLRHLNLGFNHLTGTLPTTLGMLDFELLKLKRNKLVGTIPTELFSGSIVHDDDQSFPQFRGWLRRLQLQGNALTGSIPTEIGNSLWDSVGLGGNLLSGSLPMELFNATNLMNLDINGNKISGTLPAMIGQLKNMQNLQLNNTALAGSLPSQIALLSNLTIFRIEHSNFAGTIPEEVYSGLQNIRDWRISNNQFSGTISTALGMWVELLEFSIANNRFSGELPEEIGTLANLYQVELNGNDFSTETVHDSLCALKDPGEVGPERGNFFEWQLVADCTPDANTGIPKMACPRECCTVCCDHKTQVCNAN